MPKKYSANIKPAKLIEKYQDTNALVLINQYLLDIMNFNNNDRYMSFFSKADFAIGAIKDKKQLFKEINKIDKDFLKDISSKISNGNKLERKLDI
jgi:hypothetical protein